ncbi:MAG: nucleotidyltransferase family protein [Thermomicrobiales bacterium]
MTARTAIDLQLPMDKIRDICRRFGVRELAVFGSALRDDFGPDSDIDLLVEFEPAAQVGFLELGQLEQELASAFKRRVDLGSKGSLRPFLRDEILASARILYAA